jgi:hypothetical protein
LRFGAGVSPLAPLIQETWYCDCGENTNYQDHDKDLDQSEAVLISSQGDTGGGHSRTIGLIINYLN